MIAVTTPTGTIGRQVAERLLDAGEKVRVIAREPGRLAPTLRERAEVVTGSHGDADVVDEAFAGAAAVFWVPPPTFGAATLDDVYANFTRPAAAAFARQGVARVVGVSALGRGTPVAGNAGHVTASLAMDDLIAGSGVAYRALTMPSFMDNVLRQVRRIAADGVFAGPIAGDLEVPYVATADIAAVAARLLTDDSWTGSGEVPVLGPEDTSYDAMAAVMTEVLGRPVRYERISGETYRGTMLANGASPAVAQGMLDMMLAKNAGLDSGVVRTPETSTPTSFRAWCESVLAPAVVQAGAHADR